MPTIGIDYTPAYEQGGGIGRYVRELVTALAKQDQATTYKLFVSGANLRKMPATPGINFVWQPTRLSPIWLARLWHRAQLPFPVESFTGRLNLYHATDFVLPPTLPNTQTLLTVHDLSFIRVPETASPNLRAYLDRVVPRSAQRADHILADSQTTKDDLIEIYKLPSEKITVLLSGVDDRFKPISDSDGLLTIRKKYGLGLWSYIFSVGTVQPRKNYTRLIQALAHVRAAGHDLHLVIAGGRGWLEDPIYAAIHDTHMEEYVHFIGFADETDLPSLYNAAFCCAFPSLYEGFGLPILEAMACGIPVMTSNVSSLPEVAGDAAILINPYDIDEMSDSIKQLMENSILRKTLIAKGFTRAKEFSWQKSAAQLRQIYANLISMTSKQMAH